MVFLVKDKIFAGIFGLIVGDALGVPHEFKPRNVFDENPVIDMVGYGTYNQPAGTWSDDSSMILATLDSLANGLNYEDIMDNFVKWLENAEYTPFNEVFDVGNGTRLAIGKYLSGEEALLSGGFDSRSNGNGSLMRILPISYYLFFKFEQKRISEDEEMAIIHNLSSLTHRHKRSQMACGIYVKIAIELLKEESSLKIAIQKGILSSKIYYSSKIEFSHQLKYFDRIFSGELANLKKDEINSSGYVVDTIEATIWILLNTKSYKDAVLLGVNLGEDTDTTAAVVGGLAGIYYGYDSIPNEWLNKLCKKEFIHDLILSFEWSK